MKLVEFLTKVVSDDKWRKRFCADPQGTIKGADLSRKATKAIQDGDPQQVAYVICAGEPEALKFGPID